jgi:hypothetical protein
MNDLLAFKVSRLFLEYIAGVAISLAFDDSIDFARYVTSEFLFNYDEFIASHDEYYKPVFLALDQLIQEDNVFACDRFTIACERYNQAYSYSPPPQRIDPIVFDLDGDGLETVSENNGIVFDYDNSNIKKGTGWLSSDDGFLVFDRNNDGFINNGAELFGDKTLRYDNIGYCLNGIEALAQEDSNNDGKIDELDDNWSKFQVWKDLSQDGISQLNELCFLDDIDKKILL